jgi:hypothetical protein
MPAYAHVDGKIVVFFQDSGKFGYRYSTLGFQDAAEGSTSHESHASIRHRPSW